MRVDVGILYIVPLGKEWEEVNEGTSLSVKWTKARVYLLLIIATLLRTCPYSETDPTG
jgi:hypothetical protein